MNQAVPHVDFAPDNDLERAMVQALVEPSTMPRFQAALANSDLHVPVLPDDPGATARRELRYPAVRLRGDLGVAAFTSITQLARAASGTVGCVRMTGRQLAASLDGTTPVVINPGGELGLVLTPEVVANMAAAEPL